MGSVDLIMPATQEVISHACNACICIYSFIRLVEWYSKVEHITYIM